MRFNETDLVASITRDSFYEFVKEFWSEISPEQPVWNWHVRFLCKRIQRIMEAVFRNEKKLCDQVCNISPGSTKSTIYSVMLTPWCWTRMPSLCSINGSYSHNLAMDLGRKSRDVVLSDKYQACFPKIKLRDDQNTKSYFENTLGGYRYAVGTGGSVTGMHGHIIVVDDPLNPQQAASTAELESSNMWMRETLSSRKKSKANTPTLLVMQRLHQDDATAQMLLKKNVEHICLPAHITDTTDNVYPSYLKDYYLDGYMDPDRLGKEVLEEAELELGEYGFAGQYGQNPVPAGGGKFKVNEFKYSDMPEKCVREVRFWDKAGTTGGGMFTVGVKMGTTVNGRYVVQDVIRVQLDSYAREQLIKKTAKEDGIKCLVGVEQEGGSGGKESAEATVRNLAGYKVRIVRVGKGDGDKEERADPYSSQVNGGNVVLKKAKWNKAYIEELRYFPVSKYKDQVDASSGAFNLLRKPATRCGGMKSSQRLYDERVKRYEDIRRSFKVLSAAR